MSSGLAGARWWTVALSEEVAQRPRAVACDGGRYVLFRDASGTVRALHDECAHRRAPLSLGSITAEGLVECPYHGWRYDGRTGACVQIPNLAANERVPKAYKTPAFAVAERDGFIHLWPDGLDGDESLLDDFSLAPWLRSWRGARLLAYPCDALADLLLDAPGAVLDIGSVTIADDHPYGDPVVESGRVASEYAASWTTRGKRPKHVVADYPLAINVAVNTDGRAARVDLRTDAGEPLASAYLAFTPVGPTVAGVRWRGVGGEAAGRAIEIGVLGQIRPEAVLAAYPYASKIRHGLADEKFVRRA